MSTAPDFRFEQYLDYLSFERGLSDRTLAAYGRDLRRLLGFPTRAGADGSGPGDTPGPS